MRPRFLKNYLRTYRRRLGLSQKDIAFLLGTRSEPHISRHERFVRQPTLATAFAYEALFQLPASELFAGVFEISAKKVVHNAQRLLLRAKAGRAPYLKDRQIEILRAIIRKLALKATPTQ